jgi:predicted house-cleaning noncanonical NTP pyrophosphatase (MazG superfamily)
MNEQVRATARKIDFSNLSDKELEALVPRIEEELAKRYETRKQEALEKMRKAAEAVGMTPEELLGIRPRKAARKKGTSDRITWRHPDKPELIYRGGRKPDWVKELEAAGREPVKGGDAPPA